jgi:hypothetical protein
MQSTKFINKLGKLQVAANHRYLEYDGGTPFFYLGDTAWELFHRLNREVAQFYLSNRTAKGFTVIQAVVLAELGTTNVPNAYGELPLIDRDPTTPNESYFRHRRAGPVYAQTIGNFSCGLRSGCAVIR